MCILETQNVKDYCHTAINNLSNGKDKSLLLVEQDILTTAVARHFLGDMTLFSMKHSPFVNDPRFLIQHACTFCQICFL